MSYRSDTISEDEFMFEGVKGKSPAMQKIFEVLRRVSPKNISVLLEGQSGTGKELLARAIHNNSKRRNKPFKSINCSGLTKTFLERELFGLYSGSDRKLQNFCAVTLFCCCRVCSKLSKYYSKQSFDVYVTNN